MTQYLNHADHNIEQAGKIFKIFVAHCSKLISNISYVRCGDKYWLARNTSAPTMTTTGIGIFLRNEKKEEDKTIPSPFVVVDILGLLS